jgi:hypothetical protein
MKRVLLVLASAALLGCSSDKTAGPTADVAVGVYTLQTINGSGLPFNLGTQSGVTYEVLADAYSINADGTYSEQGTLRATQGGTVTTQQEVETGVWQRNGTALTLHPLASSTGSLLAYSGSLSGSSLTITQNGLVGVYRKN